jgi:hypothetical protein
MLSFQDDSDTEISFILQPLEITSKKCSKTLIVEIKTLREIQVDKMTASQTAQEAASYQCLQVL